MKEIFDSLVGKRLSMSVLRVKLLRKIALIGGARAYARRRESCQAPIVSEIVGVMTVAGPEWVIINTIFAALPRRNGQKPPRIRCL